MRQFKRITATLLTFLLLVPFLTAVNAFAADESEDVDVWEDVLKPAYMKAEFTSIDERIKGDGNAIAAMEQKLVKDGYALYVDAKTGEVVVLKLIAEGDDYKRNEDGSYAYSGYYSTNPYSIGSSKSSTGASSTEATKSKLYAQILLDFIDNDTTTSYNSFDDCAISDQLTVKDIRNGIRVEYTLGREETNYLVPRVIKADKYEALLEQMKQNAEIERHWKQFDAYYTKKDLDDPTITEKTKVQIEMAFPITKQFAIYVCDETIVPAKLSLLEEYIKLYTDYTFEQMDEDHAETEYVSNDKTPPLFKLALEYTIDEMGLSVRCNAGNVRFDSSAFTLSNIVMLPYAGAGNVNNEGYVFTPDGSGTIIEYEDIVGKNFTITSSIYGQDQAFHTITGQNKEVIRLPVFGAVEVETSTETVTRTETYVDENGDEQQREVTEQVVVEKPRGFLAVIESGESLAKVTVENGGASHMFCSVYTSFNPRPNDSYMLDGGLSVGTNAVWTVESERKYTGDYRMRIFILDEDNATYTGMANAYREYLVSSGILTKLESDGKDIPLYLETLGALETTKTVLGVPVSATVSLTSFRNTIDILSKLKEEASITNVKIRMVGIANEGLVPLAPISFDIVEELGGEEGFRELQAYANDNGVVLYPDFDYARAYKDTWFDGFDSSTDLSRTIDDRMAGYRIYDPTWQGFIEMGTGVISPNVMETMYDKLYKEYEQYNVGGISVATLGSDLNSDFNEDEPLNREDSKTAVVKLLQKIKENNGNVMVSGGNAYTLAYVTDIIDVPLDDSQYKYSGGTVPFMGMVLHGYKEFAGSAINLAGDYQYTLLKTIENGANPYFVIAYENTSELKQYSGNSNLAEYYSVRYNIWLQDMVDTYRELNEALKSVRNAAIIDHEFLDENNKVVKVTYDNGECFYINYLLTSYEVEGTDIVIPAEDFVKTNA